ncbi:unnamed protein product, partial [Rotaria sp. Silwood2]
KIFINETIKIIWNILCAASKSQTTIGSIVIQILHLLHVLDEEKNWSSIKDSYYQHYMKPNWKTMLKFILTIGYDNEINSSFVDIKQPISEIKLVIVSSV